MRAAPPPGKRLLLSRRMTRLRPDRLFTPQPADKPQHKLPLEDRCVPFMFDACYLRENITRAQTSSEAGGSRRLYRQGNGLSNHKLDAFRR